MRRVVVTGMGIVSSIGNNIDQVLDSLLNARPGIKTAEDYVKYNFRCQVHGAPDLDPFAVLDRRTTRFMGQ
ncbi:3-oxoacyl-[acyl-carrier-protein] synthase, KASI, partial [hydrothermal vent metagenome]